MNDFYDKLEENIILCLQSKHPAIEKELYPKILMYFRTLNFNEKLLRFLYQMNILTPFVLNVIHYNISKNKAFTSKNKILDIKMLFDFSFETYKSEEFWNKVNLKFKHYIKNP